MEAKHWFGMVGLGALLVGGSFGFNQYKKPGDTPGARPLSAEGVADVETPKPRKAPPPTKPGPSKPKPSSAKPGPSKPKPSPAKPGPSKPKPVPTKPSGGSETPPKPVAPVGGGAGVSIAGRIVWDGKKPRLPIIDPSSDGVCKAMYVDGKELRAERNGIVDENNNLANVVVYVKNAPSGGTRSQEPVTIDQVGCKYVPHVFAIQLGQKLIIRNSDDTTHNVHWKSKLNDDWNVTQTSKGDIGPQRKFAKAEIGTCLFKCDMHPWMEARAAIFSHPYFAVTGTDGSFQIKNLPPGDYEVWAWHEKYKYAKCKKVTVAAGQTTQLAGTFNKKKKNKLVVAK
ncbi:MAG: hypothetical protein CMJ18_21375 [Phycisphaeraceae bacterium]|nr:hypothetical protein [Phycisphaeraceae bacterium]